MLELGTLQDKYADFYTPRFELQVGSETVTEEDGLISGLSVTTTLDRANHLSFTLTDVFDHSSGKFAGVKWSVYRPGTKVTLKIGYGNSIERLLHGRIDSVQPSFPSSGAPTVSVSVQDLRRTMMMGSSSDSWNKSTLKEVARAVAQEYKFLGTMIGGAGEKLAEKPDLELTKLIKNADSDYAFLARLAQAFGYELFSRGGVFYFRKPQRGADPTLRLQYGRSLTSYRPGEPGGTSNIRTVEVRHWDEKQAAPIVGTASRDTGDKTIVRKIPVESTEEATRRAEAILERVTRSGTSQGQTLGIPELQIGTTVQLEGLGDRFSGRYYVEEATHRIDQSGYSTSFTATEASK